MDDPGTHRAPPAGRSGRRRLQRWTPNRGVPGPSDRWPPVSSAGPYPRLIRASRRSSTAYPAVSGADGTCASTDWIAWTAPMRAADSAGITIFVFGLAANFESVSSWRIATSVGSGFWAVIAA